MSKAGLGDIIGIGTVIAELFKLLEPTETRLQIKRLRQFRRGRKKLYKEFKKDGLTNDEKATLEKLDSAYVEMLLKLGKM
jgi:hypothetical protein